MAILCYSDARLASHRTLNGANYVLGGESQQYFVFSVEPLVHSLDVIPPEGVRSPKRHLLWFDGNIASLSE